MDGKLTTLNLVLTAEMTGSPTCTLHIFRVTVVDKIGLHERKEPNME
jgi:hypothetical protein